jgi:benzoyl-CoA reductase subunit D
MREQLRKMKGMEGARVANHPDSIHAGAIGAALWGAFRFGKLAQSGHMPKAS